jgi:glutaredoxin
VREFLSDRQVPFTERNIRQDPQAKAELLDLTGKLVVPVVVAGDQRVVGYDPEWLEALVQTTTEESTTLPPRDSAQLEQAAMAASLQADLLDTLDDLVARIREELAYNAAKGGGAYRQGMHDGLRFAEEAVVAITEQHGHRQDLPESVQQLRQLDA